MRAGVTGRSGRLAFMAATVLCVLSAPVSAYFSDDFSSGLIGWTEIGDVAGVQAEAVLGDDSAAYAAMYQGIALDPGEYLIDFDVRGVLSAEIPPGTLPDTFFASVYAVDDLASFDLLNGAWQGSAALLDLAASGFTGVQGQLGPSPKGPEWSHFTGSFEQAFAYAIPVFELAADNSVSGDSTVWIDNLEIGLIPEPEAVTLILVGVGVVMAWRGRRRWVAEQ